jgi:hypothetical protein
MFQARSADLRLRRCVGTTEDGEGGSDLEDGREIIQVVGNDGVTTGLMEMDTV